MFTARVVRKFATWFGGMEYVEQTVWVVVFLLVLVGCPPLVLFAAWPLLLAVVADLVALPARAAFWGVRTAIEVRARAARRKQEAANRARLEAEQERLDAERAARADEERRRPATPSAAERAAEARARYEAAVQLLGVAPLDEAERRAALEHAKQKLLRELHEVLR